MLGAFLLAAFSGTALWAGPAAVDSTRMVFYEASGSGGGSSPPVFVIAVGAGAQAVEGTGIMVNAAVTRAPSTTPGEVNQVLRTPGTGTTPSGPVPKPEVPNVGSAGPVGTGNAFQPYASTAKASSTGQNGK